MLVSCSYKHIPSQYSSTQLSVSGSTNQMDIDECREENLEMNDHACLVQGSD